MDYRPGVRVLGIIGPYTPVQILSEYNYNLLLIGFIALAIGTTIRELQELSEHIHD